MRQFFRSTGRDSALWPVLLLLLIVLVPSAGVVWMMRAAMENERLAVRQRQADTARAQLASAKQRVADHWTKQLAQLDALAERLPPERAFAQSVHNALADSAIILDDEWRVAYPATTNDETIAVEAADPNWFRAERLEFAGNNPGEAARIYGDIAANANNRVVAARASQAQARALARDGDKHGAARVLQALRIDNTMTDLAGRSLAADAELRLLELLDKDSPEWKEVAASLALRLNDYDTPLDADQRLFLMRALKTRQPNASLPYLEAEALAAQFLELPLDAAPLAASRPTAIEDVWQIRSPSGRMIALVKKSQLQKSIEFAAAEQSSHRGQEVLVRGPAQTQPAESDAVSMPLSPMFPDWHLALTGPGGASLDLAAGERATFFLWTAVVVVAIPVVLALLAAILLRRQSRLTRLKNDLVATISHELKTPLASIRLLTDTLLEADGAADTPLGDRVRARQYLEMIAKENSRLSRLIDNFLTFSRMERGKHRFEFEPTDAADIVDQAIATIADRFDGVINALTARVDRPLPVVGDLDALVTVVVNLLDNAWKYSEEPKHVVVTARRDGERIAIAVEDNGIGLSPRAMRKVFDRFYQVDQRLARSQGGCGLGLSIVKYIVDAHGGTLSVDSRLGEGTKFTVTLPADSNAENARPLPVEPTGSLA